MNEVEEKLYFLEENVLVIKKNLENKDQIYHCERDKFMEVNYTYNIR